MDSMRYDFLTQYKAISAKLKKRFLRKPNIAEASSQFSALVRELENQECPHYAAFCCLAVARCDNTLGNTIGETQSLLQAARLFLEVEKQDHELMCPGFSENLQASISAYNHCIKRHLETGQEALAAGLCLEAGEALRNLGRVHEAQTHFMKAAELQTSCALDYVEVMKQIADCRWKIGDYDGMLSALTTIHVTIMEKGLRPNGTRLGVYSDILNEAEITRLFLLLMLKPPTNRLKKEQAELLERYSDPAAESPDYMEEDIFLLLQSLKIAVEDMEREVLLSLQDDLWPLITPDQMDVLNKLVEQTRGVKLSS